MWLISGSVVPPPTRCRSLPRTTYVFPCFAPTQITTNDPVEVGGARKVAIAYVFVEIVGILFFCYSTWCRVAISLVMWSSCLVACCCKTRTFYLLWSLVGGMMFVSHAVVAIRVIVRGANLCDHFVCSPQLIFFVQIILCCVSLRVVYTGCKAASAIMRISPAETQIDTPSL